MSGPSDDAAPSFGTSTGAHPMTWQDEGPTGVLASGGGELSLLGLPEGALTPARLSGLAVEQASDRVATLLREIVAALAAQKRGDPPRRFEIGGLDAGEIAQLDEILGSGEVWATAGTEPDYQAQESILPGLWRVRGTTVEGRVVADWIEVADVPSVVRAAARRFTAPELALPTRVPEGAMNVMPLLAEIREAMANHAPGKDNAVINFTLLPMTPVDAAFLARTLGLAPLKIVSRGYSTCTVRATGHRHVWTVQYMNSGGEIILDTLEIGDVPVSALADDHDFEDSAKRLAEILKAYRP